MRNTTLKLSVVILSVVCAALAPVGAGARADSWTLLPPSRHASERQVNESARTLPLYSQGLFTGPAAFSRIARPGQTASGPARVSPNRPAQGVFSRKLAAGLNFGTAARQQAPQVLTAQDVGTGSGDILEVEPNSSLNTAQAVAMPVNIDAFINPAGDTDFYEFQAFQGEQVNVEAFATRIGSPMIADIGLFDSSGNLLQEQVGDGVNDPLIQLMAQSTEVMFAGVTDADGLGGPRFEYFLNIEAGVDVLEVEPNNTTPQALPSIPATIFGQITSSTDVDFYSFTANAGDTLIVDVDATVFGSNLNSEVNLTDPSTGVEYFFNAGTDGPDPRFNIVLPFSGTYVIGLDAVGGATTGQYRLNISTVPGNGAPTIFSVSPNGPKRIVVNGDGMLPAPLVNVDGDDRPTVILDKHDLRAKAKGRSGSVVTVSIGPDGRRSNPLIIQ